MIFESKYPCGSHRYHWPKNQTAEDHHVIPQAWQQLWTPTGRYSFENALPVDTVKRLWDARTVPLCPTGHRNVHYWMVAMMKSIRARIAPEFMGQYTSQNYLDWAVKEALPKRRNTEMKVALLGLQRFADAGGSLKVLADDGNLGQA